MRPLVDALRAAGARVWFDETGIGPFDLITDRVRHGLATSKVLLACYSTGYPTRRACREELTLALLASRDAARVLVVNPETTAGHIVEAPLLQRRWAGPADLADPRRLASRILAQAAAVDGVFGELPGTEPARWFGGVAWQAGSRHFIGRFGLLWKLHDRLSRTSELAGGRAGRGVVIASGFGGVGKSLLAVEYAHLFASCYPGGVVWLSALGNDAAGNALPAAQTEAVADEQWAGIARELGQEPIGHDPAEVRALVRNRLAGAGRVLWIVDDLPTGLTEAQLAKWRCALPNVAELITTRDRAHPLDLIDVDVLDEVDAYAVLTQQRELDPGEAEQARLLARELGFHPLGCDVAGRYVANAGSFADYRRLLSGRPERHDELAAAVADQLPGDHARTIAASLATSLDALGPDGWLLLEMAGRLGPLPIPRRLLLDAFGALSSESDAEATLGRALLDRHSDGLWRYDPTSQSVSVHVLVRAAALDVSPIYRSRSAIHMAVSRALIAALKDGQDPRSHRRLQAVGEHARYTASLVDSDLTNLGLIDWLAAYEYAAGRYRAAAELHRRIYELFRSSHGDDHPSTLDSAGSLGLDLVEAGELAEAAELLQRVYDARRQSLGDDHPDTLRSASNLAGLMNRRGDITGAAELFHRTYEIRRRKYGDDHPSTLRSASSLAAALHDLGDVTGSADLVRRTYLSGKRLLGDDDPVTLASANNLGEVLRESGDVAGAMQLHRRTYETRRQVLGEGHPDTLQSANNLALTWQDAGDVARAAELHRRTYETRRQVLGEHHRDTLQSANNLAMARHAAGDVVGATELLRRNYERSSLALGHEHPDTLKSAANLANILYDAEDLVGAGELYRRVYEIHRRTLGDGHPYTRRSALELAEVLQETGNFAGAVALFERTFDSRRRTLGDEHPDTLQSASDLGLAYRAAGDLAASHRLLLRTYETARAVHGDEDPITLAVANNLGAVLYAGGDLAGAVRLGQYVYTVERRTLGDHHPLTRLNARNLARVLRDAGDLAGAAELEWRAGQ